ncbi:DUF3147 family protein [Lentibacillus sediminis]|uniref:DUF3147 family protein n=1 Tax=Lentibacillus sediminis TaxID=1940529 RepID=UPI000C1C7E36|nr:DUF3147 family protein [Lentibacillus sediminis]
MYVVMKILVSATVIAIVTEIARRFPAYGGIIAALPLVSLLSIIWLYVQGEGSGTLSQFALGVLWGFPATAVLILIVCLSLKNGFALLLSIGLGIGGWLLLLMLQDYVVKLFRV